MVSNAAVAHHLVPKYDEAKVVHVLHIVLLNIDPVLQSKRREWGEKLFLLIGKKYSNPKLLMFIMVIIPLGHVMHLSILMLISVKK